MKEKIQWVQPKLVCEVEFAEMTADEQLRQTTFLGWRDDKKPEEVVLEASSSVASFCQYAILRIPNARAFRHRGLRMSRLVQVQTVIAGVADMAAADKSLTDKIKD